jgi:hypothetical protein
MGLLDLLQFNESEVTIFASDALFFIAQKSASIAGIHTTCFFRLTSISYVGGESSLWCGHNYQGSTCW